MCAGAICEYSGGYDQLFFADLRGAQHHRASLQKLRAVLCPDRPRQRGVLRPHTTRRSLQLPCDGCIPAVDAEAGGRSGIQGLPPRVQAPLCVDQGRAYQRQRVLCVERAGQRVEKEMRRGYHHRGGIPAVAEGVVDKQRADRRKRPAKPENCRESSLSSG